MSQKDVALQLDKEKFEGDLSKHDKSKNNSTISTKNSQEHLICKTPQNTPPGTLKLVKYNNSGIDSRRKNDEKFSLIAFLGALQVIFGILMIACGILVAIYKSHLGYVGGGVWGGCFATVTGFIGMIANSKDWCALKATAQKVAQTIFLAMNLITIAISQLVLVVAATGLARDFRSDDDDNDTKLTTYSSIMGELPQNYLQLVCNGGLIIACGLECLTAAICAYKTAKNICPCFKGVGESSQDFIPEASKDQFISSWLGNHPTQQSFYVVAAPSTIKSSKVSMPVYTYPPPMLQPPQIVGYPLIPAPLGPIPSPIITTDHKEMIYYRQQPKKHHHHHQPYHPQRKMKKQNQEKQKKSAKAEQKQVTDEELAKTYTGLDRTIAEEFIEISESQNASLCSSVCTSTCTGGCTKECVCPLSSSSECSKN